MIENELIAIYDHYLDKIYDDLPDDDKKRLGKHFLNLATEIDKYMNSPL